MLGAILLPFYCSSQIDSVINDIFQQIPRHRHIANLENQIFPSLWIVGAFLLYKRIHKIQKIVIKKQLSIHIIIYFQTIQYFLLAC